MPDDNETKGTNRRLLLMSAWTAPVVASFALGGLASAATFANANMTVRPISQTANGTGAKGAKKFRKTR